MCGAMVYMPALFNRHPLFTKLARDMKSRFTSTWPNRTFWTTRQEQNTLPPAREEIDDARSLRNSRLSLEAYINALVAVDIPQLVGKPLYADSDLEKTMPQAETLVTKTSVQDPADTL